MLARERDKIDCYWTEFFSFITSVDLIDFNDLLHRSIGLDVFYNFGFEFLTMKRSVWS
jgi:hypothetical protein